MTESIRLLIVDDHVLFRRGLRQLLEAESDFAVVGEAGSGQEALAYCRSSSPSLQPDIILLDVHMPQGGGIAIIPKLTAIGSYKILMLSISDTDADLMSAIRAGASGYLLKNVEPKDLYRALRTVFSGYAILSPEVTSSVMQMASEISPSAPELSLTSREQEILALLAQGATTAQIAARLFISANTVKTHIRNLFEKLNASNRAEAVAIALRLGFLQGE